MNEQKADADQKYVCVSCGYIYDPEEGDPARGFEPPAPFKTLPEEWKCPICYSAKEAFDPL